MFLRTVLRYPGRKPPQSHNASPYVPGAQTWQLIVYVPGYHSCTLMPFLFRGLLLKAEKEKVYLYPIPYIPKTQHPNPLRGYKGTYAPACRRFRGRRQQSRLTVRTPMIQNTQVLQDNAMPRRPMTAPSE